MNLHNGLIKKFYYLYFINEETWNDKGWIIWQDHKAQTPNPKENDDKDKRGGELSLTL